MLAAERRREILGLLGQNGRITVTELVERFGVSAVTARGDLDALSETGALVRVPPHSSKPVTVVSKLSFPGGFAARPHQIYLSNWSIAPASGSHGATGEVLRITH